MSTSYSYFLISAISNNLRSDLASTTFQQNPCSSICPSDRDSKSSSIANEKNIVKSGDITSKDISRSTNINKIGDTNINSTISSRGVEEELIVHGEYNNYLEAQEMGQCIDVFSRATGEAKNISAIFIYGHRIGETIPMDAIKIFCRRSNLLSGLLCNKSDGVIKVENISRSPRIIPFYTIDTITNPYMPIFPLGHGWVGCPFRIYKGSWSFKGV